MDRDEVPVKCEQVHKDIGDKQSKTKVVWKHRTARRRENRTVSVCESIHSLGEGGMLAPAQGCSLRTHVLAHGRRKGRKPQVGPQPRKSLTSLSREKMCKFLIDFACFFVRHDFVMIS